MSFKNYTAPLQSSVVAVAIAGAGGYLALAYAMDWWPFKDGSDWTPWKNTAEKLSSMREAFTTGNAAAWVTNEYETVTLPNYHNKVQTAQDWLDAHPAPSGPFELMIAKAHQLTVDSQEQALALLEEKYLERLTKAQEIDAEYFANLED